MAIITSNIADLLRPGLKTVFGQLDMYPEQWTEIYKTFTSTRNYEIDVEMKYSGPAVITAEGQSYTGDSMGQRILTNYVHKKIGLFFEITKEAIDDNQYQAEFPMKALSLKNSIRVAKETLGAALLNNAFNAAFPIGDGQPVCSDFHPIDNGTYSNKLSVQAALSQGALEQIIIKIQKMKMQSGILAKTMPQKLIVSPENQFTASVLLNSQFKTGVANNDINAIYHSNYIPQGFRVNQYLNNPAAWFVLTDSPQGFKYFQRQALETDSYVDFLSDVVMCKASERISFGISNARGVAGSTGAA